MRSYIILAVLALAASTASPALSAPTQYRTYRYGNLLVKLSLKGRAFLISGIPTLGPGGVLILLAVSFLLKGDELCRGNRFLKVPNVPNVVPTRTVVSGVVPTIVLTVLTVPTVPALPRLSLRPLPHLALLISVPARVFPRIPTPHSYHPLRLTPPLTCPLTMAVTPVPTLPVTPVCPLRIRSLPSLPLALLPLSLTVAVKVVPSYSHPISE
jgi:hypothetical protein